MSHTFHLLEEVYLEVPVNVGQNLLTPFPGLQISTKTPPLWSVMMAVDNPRQARRLELIQTICLKPFNALIQCANAASESVFTIVFMEGYMSDSNSELSTSQISQVTPKTTMSVTWASHLYFCSRPLII